MKDFREVVAAGVLLLNFSGQARDEDSLPKTITVKSALAIIQKAEVSGQGCGGGTWNGESWGFYLNMYKDLVMLPWSLEPQKVQAGFVYGRTPVEHHLIEFSGPGFRYRRSTDVPLLTLVPAEPPK